MHQGRFAAGGRRPQWQLVQDSHRETGEPGVWEFLLRDTEEADVLVPGDIGEPGVQVQLERVYSSLDLFPGIGALGTKGQDLGDSSNSTMIKTKDMKPNVILSSSQVFLR